MWLFLRSDETGCLFREGICPPLVNLASLPLPAKLPFPSTDSNRAADRAAPPSSPARSRFAVRAFFMCWASSLFWTVAICLRLVWLQVVMHHHYVDKAQRQQQRTFRDRAAARHSVRPQSARAGGQHACRFGLCGSIRDQQQQRPWRRIAKGEDGYGESRWLAWCIPTPTTALPRPSGSPRG